MMNKHIITNNGGSHEIAENYSKKQENMNFAHHLINDQSDFFYSPGLNKSHDSIIFPIL